MSYMRYLFFLLLFTKIQLMYCDKNHRKTVSLLKTTESISETNNSNFIIKKLFSYNHALHMSFFLPYQRGKP